MKNKILVIVLLFSVTFYSQVSDIANLASGELKQFTKVLNLDDSIYGYLAIYHKDDLSEKEKKYEYILLDKNLNKVANGHFIDKVYKYFWGKFIYPQKMGNEIILSKVFDFFDNSISYRNPSRHGFTSHRILSLESNTISEPFYYQDGNLIDGDRDIDVENISKHKKVYKVYDYPIAFKGGFFMAEGVKDDSKYYKKITSLKAFNSDRKEKWSYEYNPRNEEIHYGFQILDEENVLLRIYNSKTKSIAFHCLDPDTGKLNFIYELENKKSDYNHLFSVKAFDDRYVILGKYASKSGSKGYNQEKAKGYYRIQLDKSGKEISRNYLPWEALISLIDIKNNGKLKDKNYRLSSKQFFAFKNGKTSIINEKRKQDKKRGMVRVRTTDFVVLNFDEDFKPISKEVIQKEKSESFWVHTDYLFSQKINDENGVAFFYIDSKKQEDTENNENRDLGIVIIKDGRISEEKIPLTDIKYVEKGKEGYILFREINEEKGIDEIRLERLNL